MEAILKKITDRIKQDEKESFATFSPTSFLLRERPEPIDIIPMVDREFFLIAEVKRGSPSKGIIRRDLSPAGIATVYEAGGASAISVITEKNFFYGGKDHLQQVKKQVNLPVLRKDFLIHPYQVYESYNLGADFVLLIVGCLPGPELSEMYETVLSLGMNALVEVHTGEELQRALDLNPKIIGINNRDLRTFQVDCNTSFVLKSLIPAGIFVISESGIKKHEDLVRLKKAGFAGVLVGESLLRQDDIRAAIDRLKP